MKEKKAKGISDWKKKGGENLYLGVVCSFPTYNVPRWSSGGIGKSPLEGPKEGCTELESRIINLRWLPHFNPLRAAAHLPLAANAYAGSATERFIRLLLLINRRRREVRGLPANEQIKLCSFFWIHPNPTPYSIGNPWERVPHAFAVYFVVTFSFCFNSPFLSKSIHSRTDNSLMREISRFMSSAISEQILCRIMISATLNIYSPFINSFPSII